MVLPARFPFYPEHVPRELKRGAWVGCGAEKVPQIAGTRRRASHSDPSTWRSYAKAHEAYLEGRHAGIGRVITLGGGFVGVDLDEVRDSESGTINSFGRGVLDLLESYSEISPSGEGVKCWVRGTLDRSYVRGGLEIYNARRFFVLTGEILVQYSAAVEERQGELLELVEREFPPSPTRHRPTYAGPGVSLERYLKHVEVFAEVRDELGTKYRIRCPWIHEHGAGEASGSYVGQRHEGGCWFRCWHAHCAGRTWRDFKRRVRRNLRRATLEIKRGGLTITVEDKHE